jgi:hypothetical protein
MEHRRAMRRWLSSVFGRSPVVKEGADIWFGETRK